MEYIVNINNFNMSSILENYNGIIDDIIKKKK